MSSVSKNVRVRGDNARFVLASHEVHGPELEPDILALCKQVGINGVAASALDPALGLLRRLLETSTEAMFRAEDAYVAEQADDRAPRDSRDANLATTRTRAVSTRAVLGAAGQPLGPYGLEAPVPESAPELVAYAKNAARRLEAADAHLDLLGSPVSTRAMARSLDEPADALAADLEQLRTETRELQLALDRRDAAVALWTRTYQATGTILAALYRLAGRDALADNVRPTERRTQGLDAPDDTTIDAPATPATPTTPPTGPTEP